MNKLGILAIMRGPYGFIMRKVTINRDTSETQINIELNLDGTGPVSYTHLRAHET